MKKLLKRNRNDLKSQGELSSLKDQVSVYQQFEEDEER